MSEFHPDGPYGPVKDITDPRYWDELRESRKRGDGRGGPVGALLGLPFIVPPLLIFGGVLYPLTALVTLATWWFGREISLTSGLTGIPMYAATFLPAAVVMWFACRWDTWLGQNFIYWLIRHIARNILFVVLMIVAASGDQAKHMTDAQQLQLFFHNNETLGVTAVLLALLNFILIGKDGVVKKFWHAGLEIVRLRPYGL